MGGISILGAGVMGSAMTLPAAAAGHRVDLVGTHLDEEIVRSVADSGFHPGLKVKLPETVRARPWTEFSETISDETRLIILGVSSAGVDWAVEQLAHAMQRPLPVLMVTKGMLADGGKLQAFPAIVANRIRQKTGFAVPVMAIAGPCIAGELAVRRNTSVVIAGEEKAEIERAIALLSAPFYHARASGDVIGVEVSAAFKNYFAIAVGTAAGALERSEAAENAAAMHNQASGLFAQSVDEIATLAEALGGRRESAYGLAGVGDLHVTCMAGRNSRMGRLLGMGLSYSTAKANHMPGDTIEGAELALSAGPVLLDMMDKGHLPSDRLPLTRAIATAICNDRQLDIPWDSFYRG